MANATQTQINRLKAVIAGAFAKAQAKGATMPAVQNSTTLEATIDSIPSGSATGEYCWKIFAEKPKVPAEITQVEYLKTTGTQYFITDYIITASKQSVLRIEADMQIIDTSSTWRVSGTGVEEPFAYIGYNASGKYAYGNNGDNQTNISGDYLRHVWSIDYVNGVFAIDNTTIDTFTYKLPSAYTQKPLYISGYSSANTHSEIIWSYKYYENNVLVREYLPGLLYGQTPILYETVNEQILYPNGEINEYGNVVDSGNEVIGYITSDNYDAYPDNGYHIDGYWYVRVNGEESSLPRAEDTKF